MTIPQTATGAIETIKNLLPNEIVVAGCMAQDNIKALYKEEEAYTITFAKERRLEFALGRHCARRALAALGQAAVPIPIGDNRAPVWPKGFVGSITHTEGCSLAAVTSTFFYKSIGIDVEYLDAVDKNGYRIVLTEQEYAYVDNVYTPFFYGTLIFSIKECIYKCCNPIMKEFIDFQDVEVKVDWVHNKFQATIINTSLPTIYGCETFMGRFSIDTQFVYTTLLLSRECQIER